jgi:hypothetical protein
MFEGRHYGVSIFTFQVSKRKKKKDFSLSARSVRQSISSNVYLDHDLTKSVISCDGLEMPTVSISLCSWWYDVRILTGKSNSIGINVYHWRERAPMVYAMMAKAYDR